MTVTLDARQAVRRGQTPAFALGLFALVAMMIGASAPSPFYPVLQQELGFSSATLTGIFAVYAIALLATLLVTGSLSDHVGRRPMISAGFALLAASMVVFWHADSVGMLFLARTAQGAASGLLMSSLSAAVVDLEPEHRPGAAATFNSVSPLAGLAVGALFGGIVLDHSSAPLVVVFGSLTAVYAAVAAVVWLLPETSPRHDGLLHSLRPRVGVPVSARPAFLRSTPALVAGWATGGLYLSLGAPIVATELGGTDHVEQGLVVTILTGVGALACYVARRESSRRITIFGTTALAVGTALTLVGAGRRIPVGVHRSSRGRRRGFRHGVPRHHALDHASRRSARARRAVRCRVRRQLRGVRHPCGGCRHRCAAHRPGHHDVPVWRPGRRAVSAGGSAAKVRID